MVPKWVDLEGWTFLVINCPLMSLSLVANVFYWLCLGRSKLKQPLKMLLELLIWTSILYIVSAFCMYVATTYSKNPLVHFVMWIFVLCNVHNSMISTVWLSIYYHVKIVPVHRAFFLWMKKNIKLVIYVAVLQQEVLVYLFGVTNCVNTICNYPKYCNGTLEGCELDIFFHTSGYYLIKVYLMVCLVMMTLSNFSVFHYLRSHMKKVARGNIVTQNMSGQLRATNAAVFQGVIYITFCIFYFFNAFVHTVSFRVVFGSWLSLTWSTLYVFGTTVNLGIGQTLFRQRAVSVWRTLTVRCGVVAPAND